MYKVIISDKNFDTVADYTGCVQLRISDSGVIDAVFYDGSQEVFRLGDGYNVKKSNMTDEEILSTSGLGEWYTDQVEKEALKQGQPSLPD
jgi:hypothetical protein